VIALFKIPKIKGIFIDSYLPMSIYIGDTKRYTAIRKSALSFYKNEWVVFVPKRDDDGDTHYEARVIKVVTSDSEYVGVLGIDIGELYVSDKSWYIKSMLLKSKLGEHGH
jgi:hypothetical protein